MIDMTTPAKVNAALRSDGALGAAPKTYGYLYSAAFTGAAIAVNGQQTQTIRVSMSTAFVVGCVLGNYWDGAALTGVALTDRRVRVSVSSNDGAYAPTPWYWDHFVGTSAQPFYLPFQLVFPAGATVNVTLYNDTTVTIMGALTFVGHAIA